MYARHKLGKEGEEEATRYLEKQNYQIIQRNFACKQGEIDIIAKEEEEYVFIEVKTRQNKNYGMPCEAVTGYKQNHIRNAARYYLYIHQLENQYIRFDVIEVYKKNNQFYINHIKKIT